MDYGDIGEPPLEGSQTRDLWSDIRYWIRIIVLGIVSIIPMSIIFIWALIIAFLDEYT